MVTRRHGTASPAQYQAPRLALVLPSRTVRENSLTVSVWRLKVTELGFVRGVYATHAEFGKPSVPERRLFVPLPAGLVPSITHFHWLPLAVEVCTKLGGTIPSSKLKHWVAPAPHPAAGSSGARVSVKLLVAAVGLSTLR